MAETDATFLWKCVCLSVLGELPYLVCLFTPPLSLGCVKEDFSPHKVSINIYYALSGISDEKNIHIR